AQPGAQERGGGVDLRDVNQDPRPEGDAIEGAAVAPEGGFGLRAADEVVPGALIDAAASLSNDLFVADEIEPHRSEDIVRTPAAALGKLRWAGCRATGTPRCGGTGGRRGLPGSDAGDPGRDMPSRRCTSRR